MITYVKQWLDLNKTKYAFYEKYPNGFLNEISENQDIYKKRKSSGEKIIIEEREFIPPNSKPVDPYEGLTIDQRIAKKVSERLIEIGYSQEIMAALLLNKITGRKTKEFDDFNNIRLQIISQVYQEEGISE